MREKLDKILEKFRAALSDIEGEAEGMQALERLRLDTLGKKSELNQLLKSMGSISPEERPAAGQLANKVREDIEEMLEEAKARVSEGALEQKLASEHIDVTISGTMPRVGRRHPMTSVLDELKQIFLGMGYDIAEGYEIETDYYNFDALNIPPTHPARSDADTFYTEEAGFSLRTSTSPMQVRLMESGKLPIRAICPGRVFRADSVDATHAPVFHQLEGIVVDEGISMGDLKGTLEVFAREFFGESTKVRFRPHYFPFTEPSAEMDVSCFACGGEGCRICKGEGFIEILGCGMVHPRVLELSGIDPGKYTGFAFGMGIERLTMQKLGINDLRLFYENDVRFLEQF